MTNFNREFFKDLLHSAVANNKKIAKEQKETISEFEKMVKELQKQTSEIPVNG